MNPNSKYVCKRNFTITQDEAVNCQFYGITDNRGDLVQSVHIESLYEVDQCEDGQYRAAMIDCKINGKNATVTDEFARDGKWYQASASDYPFIAANVSFDQLWQQYIDV